MEITQQVRDFAASQGLDEAEVLQAGLRQKAEEFSRERALYVPVAGGDAPAPPSDD
jgi:hypothetical protein